MSVRTKHLVSSTMLKLTYFSCNTFVYCSFRDYQSVFLKLKRSATQRFIYYDSNYPWRGFKFAFKNAMLNE